MKIRFRKIKSIRTRLLVIVAIAALVAVVATFFMLLASDSLLADYYDHYSERLKNRNTKYVSQLQDYIDAHDLKTSDIKEIAAFTKKHPSISVSIYRSNSTIYDSFAPDHPTSFDDTLNQSISKTYKLKFKDAKAIAVLYGTDDYHASILWGILIISVGFILFLLVVFIAINRVIKYIEQLRDEIGILETGNLDYEVTVKGSDELSELAEDLNGMRASLRDQFKLEQKLLKANKDMVTSMSHDIRTPLTSILLYTEILKSHRWKTEEQLYDYIDKIDQKTHRLKNLTDHLFEYALVSREDKGVKLSEPENAEFQLYDMLSEAGATLMQHGFSCEPDFHWDDSKISINGDYLGRIMDNIVSNICKYADPEKPVRIVVKTSGSQVVVMFQNAVSSAQTAAPSESSGIGLRNIENMMQQMNGSSAVKTEHNTYTIALNFPLAGTVLP
ncbi:MAG: histidine kinase dimerization/phospho-acceptor domain-containing protein [Eubacterium sp.]